MVMVYGNGYGNTILVAMFHHFTVNNESLMTRLAVTLVNN